MRDFFPHFISKIKGNEIKMKEFLYVGHYFDTNGNYILKIGTTNDLKRRAQEHTRKYRKTTKYALPADGEFVYDWYTPLSKYNTHRYEDSNRAKWQELGVGTFLRNDRFVCDKKPATVAVTIRKTYIISL